MTREPMQVVQALFDEYPEHFDPETEQEYVKALASLNDRWASVSDLPCDYAYYDTLEQAGLIERKNEPVFYERTPRGFRIYYRLPKEGSHHDLTQTHP